MHPSSSIIILEGIGEQQSFIAPIGSLVSAAWAAGDPCRTLAAAASSPLSRRAAAGANRRDPARPRGWWRRGLLLLFSPVVGGGRGRPGVTARLAGAGRPPQRRVVEPSDPVEPWLDP
jgi:hypothetical protein